MKSIFICFIALFLIIALPFVFDALDNANSDELSTSFAGVTTGAAVFTANVSLADSIYNNSLANVTEISSNLTGIDTPSAYVYNSVSHILTVSGLDESRTRTLSVVYFIDAELESFISTFITLFRWAYLFMIIAMQVGAIYAFFD